MSGVRVYTIPLGVPFARAFARGLHQRHGGAPPERIARMRVFVNTPRARRLVEEALTETASGSALLPRLATLTSLGADPLAAPDLPPAVDGTRRWLRLVRLVEAYLAAEGPGAAPPAAAPALAESLAGLLDELDEGGVAPEALDALADDAGAAGAEHWQRTLSFVDIVRRAWPAIRAEEEAGAMDPKARQRAAIEALIAGWRADPPGAPVIAAGSTGAVASTGRLLAEIARTQGGAVVLPGLDPGLPADIWDRIAAGEAPEHPQAPFAGLLNALGLTPPDVAPWEDTPPPARLRLIGEALRPAPVSDAWQEALPALAGEIDAAAAGMTLIEAPDPRAEAGAIALAIRRGLAEPGRRVMLVTPDAALARRVTAELARFSLTPDDSLGRPLAQTPPVVFLRLVLEAAGPEADATTLAALMQHPMMHAGHARGAHLALARAYEGACLRGPVAVPGAGRLPPWPGPRGSDHGERRAEREAWHANIEAALAPLARTLTAGATLSETLSAHRAAAEALSDAGEGAGPVLWSGSDGEAARALLERLAGAAEAYGPDTPASYPALLAALLAGEEVRPDPTAPHPRLVILGPREARMQEADLTILAGLNDATWPALPGADPWLSRPMRRSLGLPAPEARIGLSAHDFAHAAARGEIVLTRSLRSDSGPTVASRWLTRLTTLMSGLDGAAGLADVRARGSAILAHLPHVHGPGAARAPAPRPMPCPDVAARPRRLSVTEVETLVRDAYAIYAKHVLGLRPREPLGRSHDARERGTALHEILRAFVADTPGALSDPAQARARLVATAERVLAETVPAPDLRRIWRARLIRAADWFIAHEQARRAVARPAALEVSGEADFPAPGGAFTLRAKADRIDLRTDGAAEILDYKTGKPPTSSQIAAGFNLQLHLQAAILAAGGFDGLGAHETAAGEYIGLTGANAGGEATRLDAIGDELPEHQARFLALIAAYDSAETPYISRGRAYRTDQEGDYDHLARRSEWEGAGE